MRTIGLFIAVLVMPVLFFSCYPCGKGGDPGFWTISSMETHAFKDDLQTEVFSGDTISGDSLHFRIQLNTTFLSQNTFSYNPYAAMACSPADPTQTNKVIKINWGLKYPGINQIDTNISNSLSISRGLMQWQWPTQMDEFIQELSNEFVFSISQTLKVKALSPHTNSNIQLIMQFIKQNGDTLVSSGPVVFCK
jgi:hypothetical protein